LEEVNFDEYNTLESQFDVRAERFPNDIVKFGVCWNKSDAAGLPALERLYDSVGKGFIPSIGSAAGHSDFDNEPIYKDIRLCNVSVDINNNAHTVIYEGEPGFERVPLVGDVMVEIPKFYCKIDHSRPDCTDFLISNYKIDDTWFVSPAHMDRGDGAGERDYIYVGAYTSDEDYRSISGRASRVSMTRAAFRAGHRSRAQGAGYETWDYATWITIQMLYLVECANWSSQNVVGAGNTLTRVVFDSGETDGVAWHSGRLADTADHCVKYRNMENLWGNLLQWIDGICFSGTSMGAIYRQSHISLNPEGFVDTPSSGCIQLSYGVTNSSGFITAYGHDNTMPWAMLPTHVGGSQSTFVCDSFVQNGDWTIPLSSALTCTVGGAWNSGTGSGLFHMNNSVNASSANIRTGARIMYLPR
jgi:hypothetical protein